jgi:TM2 domain-containing membrane protein YozV
VPTLLGVPNLSEGRDLEEPEVTTEPTPRPAEPPAVPADVSSKKIAAGICGILLGYLGIHKFILGMTTPGLIMLLVSLLTCGIGAIPMMIIGLVVLYSAFGSRGRVNPPDSAGSARVALEHHPTGLVAECCCGKPGV